MKTIVHKANTRGHANYGWLDTNYTFSFAGYYDPERIHFGALRVLNDDIIAGGHGFDKHPHDNMEIITVMLDGEIRHNDSMGNTFVLKKDEIQVMSAGTGIFHSEFNNLPDKEARLLQIWVFPERKNITPRYDQIALNAQESTDKWYRIVAPDTSAPAQIRQNAYFSLITSRELKSISYPLVNSNHGVYVFVIDGEVNIGSTQLEKRDGMGIWETEGFEVSFLRPSKLLVMEVPMF